MEEQQKAYYAIIPANVRYDKDLAPNAKLLYGEITALCNEKGYCWASNQYFADLYRSSISAVQKWVSALVEKGYINLELVYKEGTKQVLHRKLYITPGVNIYTTSHKNLYDPGVNIYVDNNKDINNTFNNTNIYKEKNNKKESVNSVIAEYTENKDLQDALHGFVEMRNKARKPLTARAMKLSLNKLNELALDDVTKIAIVNQSIMHNWLTFYKLQNNNNGGQRQLTRKEMGYAF